MIDKLRSIAIFSKVVEQGSFRGAALHLGLAPSRVSETVSNLEKDLGVTLLYRSTRQLSLTHEGRVLHDKAQSMLAEIEGGLDTITNVSRDPQGALRVTAPAFIAQTWLMDRFAAFAQQYPKIDLTFDFSDATRDIIKDGFDVSIRAGWLEDSDLMSRKLGYADRLLVAHPNYIARMGVPAGPKDLEAWDWVHFSVRTEFTHLYDAEGEVHVVGGKSHITVNSAISLYEFAARGLGITTIPETLAHKGFARGELAHVLPAFTLKRLGLHAVWPDQSRRESLTRLFVRSLAKPDA